MGALLIELRGLRRALLILAILFLTIMLLEVDLDHRPALATQGSWLALVPVVWLPLTLFSLIAVQLKPTLPISIVAQAATAIAAAVGMVGSGLHMMAAGVDLEHLSRLFSSAVWGGPVSPNWPVAITVAAVLGFIGAFAAERDEQIVSHDVTHLALCTAYVLILAGIAFGVAPDLVMASAAALVAAALLLLAALIGMLTSAAMQRSAP